MTFEAILSGHGIKSKHFPQVALQTASGSCPNLIVYFPNPKRSFVIYNVRWEHTPHTDSIEVIGFLPRSRKPESGFHHVTLSLRPIVKNPGDKNEPKIPTTPSEE